MSGAAPGDVLSPDALEARLRAIGAERYHHRHPFNVRMHEGRLTRDELRTWALNRYYYQTRIPVKDSLIVSKAGDAAFRREWVQRIHDHDGEREGDGGLALWLRLAEAVGCDAAEVERQEHVLPGVRRACDAYVELVQTSDLLTSVAASLTEMFAGDIMAVRIAAFEKHYPWVEAGGLAYFRSRTQQAPRDAAWGLRYVREHATDATSQARAAAALERKCDILWSLLDAVERACARPRLAPHAQLRFDSALERWLCVLPERAVALGGSGRDILERCTGDETSEAIARALAARPGAGPHARDEVHDFLEQMARHGVLRFLPAGAARAGEAATARPLAADTGARAPDGPATDGCPHAGAEPAAGASRTARRDGPQ